MEPVLTQEELEAIYSAMNADMGMTAPVDDFSLTTGRAFQSQAIERWTETAKSMVKPLEGILTGALGRRIKLATAKARVIDEGSKDQYANWGDEDATPEAIRDDTAIIKVVKMGDVELLLGIDRILALKYIERITGADFDDEESESKERDLTILEHRLLRDFLENIIKTSAEATSLGESKAAELTTPADVWKKRDPQVPWMEIMFSSPQQSSIGLWFRGPAMLFFPKPNRARVRLTEQIKLATVELVAELGRFRLKVSELWQLKPGTLIPMNVAVGDPLPILIGGVTKLKGDPLVSRGNIAIRVLDRNKGGEE